MSPIYGLADKVRLPRRLVNVWSKVGQSHPSLLTPPGHEDTAPKVAHGERQALHSHQPVGICEYFPAGLHQRHQILTLVPVP